MRLLKSNSLALGKKQPDSFSWRSRPASELDRLARLLSSHLKSAGVRLSERNTARCRQFTDMILKSQSGTCFLAGGDDRYCWNHPKNSGLEYLKLEWGHKVPKSQGGVSELSNLVLLCARCNNHLQTSRTLRQLVPELQHKLAVLSTMAGELG